MASFRYYLGPYLSVDNGAEIGWGLPPGCRGGLDLGNAADKALDPITNTRRGLGLFWTIGTLGVEWKLLGDGDLRSIAATATIRSALRQVTGTAPQGVSLVDLVWDILTSLSDTSGVTAPRPLMPTTRGSLDLVLGGHSKVRSERFQYGVHTHTIKVRDNLRRDYRAVLAAVESGRRSPELHRKMLGSWKRKYGVPDERVFIPDDLPKIRALEPATSFSESFNQDDSTTLGPDLTWTETTGDLETASNNVQDVGQDSLSEARAEHDVSSDDHFTQMDVLSGGGTGVDDEVRILARFDSTDRTHYGAYGVRNATDDVSLFKRNVGSFTELTRLSQIREGTLRLEVEGSNLTFFDDDSEIDTTTDTQFTGRTRGGIVCRNVGLGDNFLVQDLDAGILSIPVAIASYRRRHELRI